MTDNPLEPDPTPWTQQRIPVELAALGIAHEVIEHPAVHTVEAAREHWSALPGLPVAATLAVERGSVTPLAVVNDAECRVSVVLDATLAGADAVRFLAQHGHPPSVIDLAG